MPSPDQPSPEFRLVCAACQWPRERRDVAVRAAAAGTLDWDRVARITRRHRVRGLVADALASPGLPVPAAFREQLKGWAQEIARHNLFAAAETARLGQRFDAAGIDWISFKGLSLAIRAYGTLAVKQSNDIDLLVAPERAIEACRVLAASGYERFNPGADIADDQLATWIRAAKEVGWKHPGTGLIVELHERMTANPALFPLPAIAAARARVELAPGLAVPTLGDDLLFPYLAAHGARDAWFRLKWLADVAALLSGCDAAGIEAHYRNAQRLGVGRCAAQALLLANRLLGLPLDPAFERVLLASPIHRLMLRVALRAVGGAHEAEEHSRRSMLPVQVANLLLRRGLGYKWGELAALAANPRDRAREVLPAGLGFLYPVLGGVRWSGRMLGLKPR
jgi:hypothetical protein